MSSQSISKLNSLLRHWPRETIAVQSWLNSHGIYRQLAERYCESQWIKRVGQGAYCQIDDKVDWKGAVYALQYELSFNVYIGAQTALELQGYSHYITLGKEQPVWLIKPSQEHRSLPRWFKTNFMKTGSIHFLTRHLFDDDNNKLGLMSVPIKDFKLKVSSPERAIMECIELAPQYISLEQITYLMQAMTTLRPQLLQSLLEHCCSIKTKRLFLLFAEREGHAWFSALNLKSINLGKGKRVIGKGGYYYSDYEISLPIQLNTHEGYTHDHT